jgi:hypothetical protein
VPNACGERWLARAMLAPGSEDLMRSLSISIACLAAAGCGAGADYAYIPENASVRVDGAPAAKTEIPPEEPRGEVRVATLGVTELENGRNELRALHVRLVVTNEGDPVAWTIDTRRQILEVPGQGQTRAAFVNADVQGAPLIAVGPRDKRTIDLYFPLPRGGQPGRFDLLWEVGTGLRPIADRTTFDLVEQREPSNLYVASGWGLGWGPYWWHDPWYRPFAPSHTIVVRYPRGKYRPRR